VSKVKIFLDLLYNWKKPTSGKYPHVLAVEINAVDPWIGSALGRVFLHSTCTSIKATKPLGNIHLAIFVVFFSRLNCLILGLAWVEPSYTHYSRDEFPRIGTYACG